MIARIEAISDGEPIEIDLEVDSNTFVIALDTDREIGIDMSILAAALEKIGFDFDAHKKVKGEEE